MVGDEKYRASSILKINKAAQAVKAGKNQIKKHRESGICRFFYAHHGPAMASIFHPAVPASGKKYYPGFTAFTASS